MATGTGNLPNPTMSFSPFAILTAEEMNDLVENIESLATGTGIGDGSVTPESLMDGAGSTWTWPSWTPTWTNLSVGNGTVTTKYSQAGKIVTAHLNLVFGTTTAVTGDMAFTLPVAPATYGGVGTVQIGSANLFDTSAVRLYQATVSLNAGKAVVRPQAADLTYLYVVTTSATVPFTWTTGDEAGLTLVYEAL